MERLSQSFSANGTERKPLGLGRCCRLGDTRDLDRHLSLPLLGIWIGVDDPHLPQGVPCALVEVLPLALAVVRPLRDRLDSTTMKAPRGKYASKFTGMDVWIAMSGSSHLLWLITVCSLSLRMSTFVCCFNMRDRVYALRAA